MRGFDTPPTGFLLPMSNDSVWAQTPSFHKLGANVWHVITNKEIFFIPKEWRFWLLSFGSLTKQLRTLGNTDISVKLLSQKYQRPMLSERKAFGNSVGKTSFVREVLLCDADSPIVFARTVCPRDYRNGIWREIQELGDRSLGDWLFGNHCAIRTNVKFARLNSSNFFFTGQALVESYLWGRRSTFNIGDSSILVTEIFLPDFEALKSQVNKQWK